VLYKLDPCVMDRLTSKSGLRGIELSGLDEFVEAIELIGINHKLMSCGPCFPSRLSMSSALPNESKPQFTEPVIWVSRDFLKSD
jgi:hypothetical protein